MSRISELHRKWSGDPGYRAAYDELEAKLGLARLLIKARAEAGLTQAQLAERLQMTQSAVARFEGGSMRPSAKTLGKIERATGTRIRISFETGR